jgi:hypothetical protein
MEVVVFKAERGECCHQGDPAFDLFDHVASLDCISKQLRTEDNDGLANMLELLAYKVSLIADRMDNEGWHPISEEEKEAHLKKIRESSPPDGPLKSNEEAIQTLEELFEIDEEDGVSIKRMIDMTHFYAMKRREKKEAAA